MFQLPNIEKYKMLDESGETAAAVLLSFFVLVFSKSHFLETSYKN